jgi:branched-chain amino acid transport system ATP-binding protein
MLEVIAGAAGYDRQRSVIEEVNIDVREGELVGVLGANGAGKSTLFQAIMGMCRWHGGRVLLSGEDITSASPRKRVQKGMAYCPQGHQLFHALSVEDNLLAGALTRPSSDASSTLRKVYGLFTKLAERRHQRAGTLSGGERALVAVGRALMSRPRFLLLDEPSLGLSAGTRRGVFEHLRGLCSGGELTVLLAEQDAANTLTVADIIYGMRGGRIVGWRLRDQVGDADLQRLYLTGASEAWGASKRRDARSLSSTPDGKEI